MKTACVIIKRLVFTYGYQFFLHILNVVLTNLKVRSLLIDGYHHNHVKFILFSVYFEKVLTSKHCFQNDIQVMHSYAKDSVLVCYQGAELFLLLNLML